MAQKSAAEEADVNEKQRGGLLLPLIIGLALGGAAFYATFSGMVSLESITGAAPDINDAAESEEPSQPHEEIAFVPVAPLIITLGPRSDSSHLKIEIVLEVDPAHQKAVQALLPRIRDLMNIFLRSIDHDLVNRPNFIIELRAHLLHRIGLLTPAGAVKNILIQEFLLN